MAPPTCTYEIVVSDNTTAPSYGRLYSVPVSSFTGLGNICNTPPLNPLTNDWEIPLSNHNFIFSGQSAGDNRVGIGLNTLISCVPSAKLDVLQSSLSAGSKGINVLNTDNSASVFQPAIGIKAKATGIKTVAGWFEAMNTATSIMFNAIFVPKYGGSTRLGFSSGTAPYTGYYLEVEGNALINGIVVPSDVKFKNNIYSFNNGLNVIRNISTYSYKYNGKAGYDTVKTYIGVIAEELAQIAPYAVDTFYSKLDTTDVTPTELLAVKNEAIMYTAINAIKELDAEVTTLQEAVPPDMPVLISPANGTPDVTVSATFKWHKAERADYYTIIINSNGLPPYNYQAIVSDTVATIKLPYSCTLYNWTVTANNQAGLSQTPETWMFQTKMPDAPATPILVSPSTGTENLPLMNVFTWNASERAEKYTMYISTTDNYDGVVTIAPTQDTFALAVVPLCNTKYYWFVVAENCGGISDVSEKWSFMAYEPSIATPTLIAPVDGAIISEGTPFDWVKVNDAINYNIFISTSTDEADVVYNTSLPSAMNFLLPVLREERQYYWWVTACNRCGVCSDRSEIRSFYYVEPLKTSDPILSDSNFKTNLSPITDALSKVLQLNGKYFNWNLASHPELKDTARQMGLIAQEVLPVVPEVIKVNRLGQYSLDYERLVSLFIEATKEQQTQITTMANEIDALKTSFHNCCDSNSVKHMTQQTQNSETISIINTELTNKAAILYQNMPNPFGDGTTIRYFIPDDVNSAAIVFHNEFGQELKTVEITDKGMGQLNLTTTNLSGGIYTYSLLIDGKLIETKRMMKIK